MWLNTLTKITRGWRQKRDYCKLTNVMLDHLSSGSAWDTLAHRQEVLGRLTLTLRHRHVSRAEPQCWRKSLQR